MQSLGWLMSGELFKYKMRGRPVLLSLFLRPAAKYGEVTKYVAGARKSGASAKATI